MSSSSKNSPSESESSHKSNTKDDKHYDSKKNQFKYHKKQQKNRSKDRTPSLQSSPERKRKLLDYKDKKDSKQDKASQKKKNDILLSKIRVQKQSDFRCHLTFNDLPIQKEYQQQFLNLLKDVLSEKIGKVEIIQKLDRSNEKDRLSISLAFRKDSHALVYLDEQKGELQIKFKDTKITLKPTPSIAFKYYMNEARSIRKQQQKLLELQKRKEEEARRKQKQKQKQKQEREKRKSDRHRKSRSRDREKEKKNRDKRKGSSQTQRSFRKNNRQNLVILRLFGIPKRLKQKAILPALKKHPDGPFKLQTWKWVTIQKVEYFEISLPQKAAYTLMNMKKQFELQQIPLLILKCGKDTESIKNALAEHQVKVEFPHDVHPLNVYNTFKQFGKIIQLVGQNNQNTIYYITFLQAKSAKTVKNLKLEDSGIVISYLKEGQLVYRPTRKTTLKYLMKSSQLYKNQNEKSIDQRRKESRRE